MKKMLILAFVLLMLVPLTVSAAGPRVDMTMTIEAPEMIVVVQAGDEFITFTHKNGLPVTKSVPVADQYILSARNSMAYDIFVLEGANQDELIAASWWPGRPYTANRAVVDHTGTFTILRELRPKTGYSVGIAPVVVGNQLQLRVVNPQMICVVQDVSLFATFWSRPQGVTRTMLTAGPYKLSARNSTPMNVLVFDEDLVLVGRSFHRGDPYTRFRATVPGPGMYWIFQQYVPPQLAN
ncbi:hypothetical protein COT51_00330 [candidate division WWE3 bacterium CG08_land_8_20_14_0_20_41_15]|uniref:YkuD domain-containing protein n=1 Tax=candidate division WWE3 bacterium CG08_land_8_20_14_0_20_41_15 TaxID=1975086 RepID=A0A2H0XAE7_UNCKA|nr:MAG: hypothetical protein COT51_00330 [candidate division WWE3 bacterium CG08_land_8_20_14_0_20_41_15]